MFSGKNVIRASAISDVISGLRLGKLAFKFHLSADFFFFKAASAVS